MRWWTFVFLLPNCASERGFDWYSDGVGFFDGRLQMSISGAWQTCLFISHFVSAPTHASAPASASWFDFISLVVVSFLWLIDSVPAGTPAPACKGAAQAPAPVSAPAPSSGPLLSVVSIWFWAHGLVPQ